MAGVSIFNLIPNYQEDLMKEYITILKIVKGFAMEIQTKRIWLLATSISLPVFIWQLGNILQGIVSIVLALK
jgi:hypothetical protein